MGFKYWLITRVVNGEIEILTLNELRPHVFRLFRIIQSLCFEKIKKFIDPVNIPSYDIFLQRRFLILIFKYSRQEVCYRCFLLVLSSNTFQENGSFILHLYRKPLNNKNPVTIDFLAYKACSFKTQTVLNTVDNDHTHTVHQLL